MGHIDSKTVFDVVGKHGRTKDNCLQIELSAIRQSYTNILLSKVDRIRGRSNPEIAFDEGW